MKNRILVAILPVLACFALLQAQAQTGCNPNFTTKAGCDALKSLDTGVGDTAIGWRALFSDSTGSFNTGVGGGALSLNNADSNTAVGAAALLLNTTGTLNTAVGTDALPFNDSGSDNNAVGAFALFNNVSGSLNNAVGGSALSSNVDGASNNALGDGALLANVSSSGNTAVGDSALSNSTGSVNTALGVSAGINQDTGSNNIYICDSGVAGESNVIRIGSIPSTLLDYTTTFIGGIYNAIEPDRQVFVGVDGKLGTLVSSRRYKEDINPMDKASEALFEMKPVTFRYKRDIDPSHKLSFGLIAEDVAKISTDLVSCDKEGKPQTVRYEAINAMLLNEFIKEHAKMEQLRKDFEFRIVEQQKQIEALTAGLQKVSAQLELRQPAPHAVVTNK